MALNDLCVSMCLLTHSFLHPFSHCVFSYDQQVATVLLASVQVVEGCSRGIGRLFGARISPSQIVSPVVQLVAMVRTSLGYRMSLVDSS